MPTNKFCEHCVEDAQRAYQAGEDFEDPEMGTNEVMLHDGIRLTVVHVCDRHSGAVIECGARNWGAQYTDEVLAFPLIVN